MLYLTKKQSSSVAKCAERYDRTFEVQEIAEALRGTPTGDLLNYLPAFNIAPTTTQSVLRQERDTLRRELVPMRWGLVGLGSKCTAPKRSTFNARAESLEHSAPWKRPFHRQRCTVPMSGYNEWRKTNKVPFRFETNDNPILGAAGLWDAWKPSDGQWLQSCAIITTDPNTVTTSVHDRMPVLLQHMDFDE